MKPQQQPQKSPVRHIVRLLPPSKLPQRHHDQRLSTPSCRSLPARSRLVLHHICLKLPPTSSELSRVSRLDPIFRTLPYEFPPMLLRTMERTSSATSAQCGPASCRNPIVTATPVCMRLNLHERENSCELGRVGKIRRKSRTRRGRDDIGSAMLRDRLLGVWRTEEHHENAEEKNEKSAKFVARQRQDREKKRMLSLFNNSTIRSIIESRRRLDNQ